MVTISRPGLLLLEITGKSSAPLRRENAGDLVQSLHRAIGRDPEVFPDGDEFKPERWLDKDGKVKQDMKVNHGLSLFYADNLIASIILCNLDLTHSFLPSASEDGTYHFLFYDRAITLTTSYESNTAYALEQRLGLGTSLYFEPSFNKPMSEAGLHRSMFINTTFLLWSFHIKPDPKRPIDTLAFREGVITLPLPFAVHFEARREGLREMLRMNDGDDEAQFGGQA